MILKAFLALGVTVFALLAVGTDEGLGVCAAIGFWAFVAPYGVVSFLAGEDA